MRRLTRRQALAASGAGIVAAGSFSFWGRYALGDEFETHVADLIGLDRTLTSGLLANLRDQIGTSEYDLRATAFLLATTEPSETVMPRDARERAVRGLIGPLFGGLVTPLTYAGLRDNVRYTACEVLVRA